jgi:hypothetical protein
MSIRLGCPIYGVNNCTGNLWRSEFTCEEALPVRPFDEVFLPGVLVLDVNVANLAEIIILERGNPRQLSVLGVGNVTPHKHRIVRKTNLTNVTSDRF